MFRCLIWMLVFPIVVFGNGVVDIAKIENSVVYKQFLFLHNDQYSCNQLSQYRCGINTTSSLDCVSELAIKVCNAIGSLNSEGKTLNDTYNSVIIRTKGETLPVIWKVTTLFAPYTMTYDPDDAGQPIGKPLVNMEVQKAGMDKVTGKLPSCINYKDGKLARLSPYTSHCSAFAAWVSQKIFGVNLFPTQVGDWCHVAAEQRDRMLFDTANWLKVSAVSAQKSANQGKLVIAVLKKSNKDKEAHQQDGHIAIVIPNVTQLAALLRAMDNYPHWGLIEKLNKQTTSTAFDNAQFTGLIQRYGPEVTQAGGLNFNHTVAANAFANYYASKTDVGKLMIDELIEFYVYIHKTQPEYENPN